MQVIVLVIIHKNEEYISIHDNDGLAWPELVRFVDNKWDQHFAGLATPIPSDEEERVALFFSSDGDSYIMGSADVSEIEAQMEAVFRG